ncbi:hypothetical protein FHW16_003575 [Phyllobacterium myrsinacearum]|uniref:Uncharacterized protein n=1 Tax=Phyllobacterium myrsinacearum TaxID=28101 RepID=A0A839ER34_9HYPH|nr:hypothetical protein [Phyllobacterium myrsinacearum]
MDDYSSRPAVLPVTGKRGGLSQKSKSTQPTANATARHGPLRLNFR